MIFEDEEDVEFSDRLAMAFAQQILDIKEEMRDGQGVYKGED